MAALAARPSQCLGHRRRLGALASSRVSPAAGSAQRRNLQNSRELDAGTRGRAGDLQVFSLMPSKLSYRGRSKNNEYSALPAKLRNPRRNIIKKICGQNVRGWQCPRSSSPTVRVCCVHLCLGKASPPSHAPAPQKTCKVHRLVRSARPYSVFHRP